MHLGGNRRWVPPTFENNNNNKRYCAHKYYFTISSAVSSIRLHSRGQILSFSWGKILFLPHRFGQHIVEQEVESGKNCLFNQSKQIGLVDSRTYDSGWTNNVTAAVTANPSGGTPHMKGVGMLIVSLRGINFAFWSHLGCSGQNAIIFSRESLV